jgi:hypothetical protein
MVGEFVTQRGQNVRLIGFGKVTDEHVTRYGARGNITLCVLVRHLPENEGGRIAEEGGGGEPVEVLSFPSRGEGHELCHRFLAFAVSDGRP